MSIENKVLLIIFLKVLLARTCYYQRLGFLKFHFMTYCRIGYYCTGHQDIKNHDDDLGVKLKGLRLALRVE